MWEQEILPNRHKTQQLHHHHHQQQGRDWSEDLKPKKQSQQTAKEETDVNRVLTAASKTEQYSDLG